MSIGWWDGRDCGTVMAHYVYTPVVVSVESAVFYTAECVGDGWNVSEQDWDVSNDNAYQPRCCETACRPGDSGRMVPWDTYTRFVPA